jgi:hypothetical protein
MKYFFLLTLLAVLQSYCPAIKGQGLQFYREDIVFKINEDAAEADAVYHFCNVDKDKIITTLFYPFPGNTMELIDSILIRDFKTGEIISFRQGKSGVFFEISVTAYGQAAYRVFFRQKLEGQKFKYILTSTGNWGKELEFANFELQVPVSLKVDSLSFTPDSSFIQDDFQYYIWKKKDFMPEKDFEVFLKNP